MSAGRGVFGGLTGPGASPFTPEEQHDVQLAADRCVAILEAKARGEGSQYSLLLVVLREASAASAHALRALSLCTRSLLSEKHTKLVCAVLSLPWQDERSALAEPVLSFMQELVCAAPCFLRQCIDALIQSFLQPAQPEGASRSWVAPRVHETLAAILRSCPLATGFIFESLREHFPHKRRDTEAHTEFLRQTLALLRYAPALQPRVMQLLVVRMVDIDVEIALQQRQLEEEAEAAEEEDAIFDVDLDEKSRNEDMQRMRRNADTLDNMLQLMFLFIRDVCKKGFAGGMLGGFASATTTIAPTPAAIAAVNEIPITYKDAAAKRAAVDATLGDVGGPSGAGARARLAGFADDGLFPEVGGGEHAEPAAQLFDSLLATFHSSLLHTYKSRCTQFLLFYCCSFEVPLPPPTPPTHLLTPPTHLLPPLPTP